MRAPRAAPREGGGGACMLASVPGRDVLRGPWPCPGRTLPCLPPAGEGESSRVSARARVGGWGTCLCAGAIVLGKQALNLDKACLPDTVPAVLEISTKKLGTLFLSNANTRANGRNLSDFQKF